MVPPVQTNFTSCVDDDNLKNILLKWCMHIYPRIKTFANKRFRLMRGSNSSYICQKKMCSLFYFFHDFLWITITFIEYILPHSSFALLRGAILILYVQHLIFHINILNAFAYMTFTPKLTLNFAWNILSLDIIFFSMRMDMTCELCESSVITQILYI